MLPRPQCPHCGATLPWYGVLYLDPRGAMCLDCDGYYIQSWKRTLLPFAAATGPVIAVVILTGFPRTAVVIGFAVYFVAAVLSMRPQPKPMNRGPLVPLEHVRELVEWLTHQDDPEAFVSVVIPGQGPGKLNDVVVQFSNIHRKTGLDWLSITGANRRDRPKVRRFSERAGCSVTARRSNGVSYLRIEVPSNTVQFCFDLLRTLYGVELTHPVEIQSNLSVTSRAV
jgi:hypothetical protein